MSEKTSNPIVDRELELQKSWKEDKIFQKSLEATKNGPVFNFYDGPPFATGTPHYGHLVASVMKDVVPRYWTMKGFSVERKWGWDCHGLPIENIVEKELGFKSKKDIEEYGIDKFNETCRSKVLTYVEEWKKTISRFGRWADMENPYKTMDTEYMESVWWVFKELYDKGLVYEGYKSMHVCPRCETTLSQMEVSEGYKDVEDLTVTWKFKVIGQDKTYLLAWTTVPWSTLSTMGLAVGADHNYIKARVGDEYIIFIKDQLEKVMAGHDYEIVEEFKGNKMVGWEYEPVVDFYKNLPEVQNSKNVYHVLATDYVEVSEGTGIVTINGSYGEIDLVTAQKYELPVIMDVKMDGHLADIAKDYAGMYVKDAEKKFISDMEKKNLVWSTQKYVHSYPHCWRCDTPLLNYSTSSWFVKVTEVKDKAMKLAKDINWSPEHIKEGRFGKWLEGARDWSISRQRFWASVIPIWKCQCGEMKVYGSVEELYNDSRNDNGSITKIIFVRHGEAENNPENIFSSDRDSYPLTAKGHKQVVETAKKLSEELKNDLDQVVIYSSPILRTRQTAEIIAKKLGLEIMLADDIHEVSFGSWENQKKEELNENNELRKKFNTLTPEEKFDAKYGGDGESQADISQRMFSWLEKVVDENRGRTIIVVSHGDPIMDLINKIKGRNKAESTLALEDGKLYIHKAETKVLFVDSGNKLEVDLHKHKIDKVFTKCEKCGGEMKRVPDVLDTWFDSGSMPYAQQHYPFENREKFEDSFPAQFIAEGVDQTRAWFYYLHVIATSIKKSRAFSNVIVNGIVLAEDGKKMAKKLQNYPEPEIVMEKYGADALRYYLLCSPVVSAENMNFSEVGVKEAMQKVIMLTNNILNFYKLYEDKSVENKLKTDNILDKWLLSKFNSLIQEVTKQMEAYDLPRSVRPIQEFIDEFSTWWLRRSRDRFKGDNEKDKEQALAVFRHVLMELAKVMAPFTPFVADYLYKQVGGEKESVHLEKWPEVDTKRIDEKVLSQMETARKIVELGLAKRAEAGIKIRQPLNGLVAYGFGLSDEFLGIICDEVNVKKAAIAKGAEQKVELDKEITEELQIEGMLRELVRTINDLRKKQGLNISNNIIVIWQSDSAMLQKVFADRKNLDFLRKNTIAEDFINEDINEAEIKINNESIRLKVKKL